MAEEAFYHHDRDAVRELALLWREDIPGSQNKPYIDKAMELEAELQTVLTAQIGKEP